MSILNIATVSLILELGVTILLQVARLLYVIGRKTALPPEHSPTEASIPLLLLRLLNLMLLSSLASSSKLLNLLLSMLLTNLLMLLALVNKLTLGRSIGGHLQPMLLLDPESGIGYLAIAHNLLLLLLLQLLLVLL